MKLIFLLILPLYLLVGYLLVSKLTVIKRAEEPVCSKEDNLNLKIKLMAETQYFSQSILNDSCLSIELKNAMLENNKFRDLYDNSVKKIEPSATQEEIDKIHLKLREEYNPQKTVDTIGKLKKEFYLSDL